MFRLTSWIAIRAAAVLTAAVAALAGATPPASAQSWPQRPVNLIVPFPAGGGTDAFARPLAAQLEIQLKQRFLIDNRGGAGGTIGASAAAKAEPNGYTFLVGAAHHAIAPSLYPKLDYDIEKDFIPVAVIAMPPQVIVVNPGKVEAKTLAEFIAYAKANPNKINYASAGAGTTHHLAGELFKILTQTQLNHVPYRGAGPAMQDLVAGHVHAMFDGLGSSANQIQSGALRGLAVAATTRSPAIPEVPTSAEAGLKGYEVSTWYAVFAPKGTPEPIVDQITTEIRKALDADAIKEAWKKNGSPTPTLVRADFGKFVTSEVARWGKVVKDAGIKIEAP
ncbi:tripartite tricarboxylate transporter substrate binding protein [Bradyrhizobium sp. LHD-71]|uniref:Bug family tripartite tricarboxylate transporter substrate binding protein n=1 Tax=Bradyrhizobium sp. LHD-71 TaxID=3072141 RepID=UPI0028102587|nr:tripartite tricarboxylate transporter substrate binding protein [Bradyrhizobium sp. LHD-71]MDQ8726399.1 tripartite tricarboxylate transporter substrate binding protein [Bradyrhizobium sp. LHD-71]